jgi:hypothetical protein
VLAQQERELRRLDRSLMLSPVEEQHKWKLMAKIIMQKLDDPMNLSEVQKILTEFKKKRVHPDHD